MSVFSWTVGGGMVESAVISSVGTASVGFSREKVGDGVGPTVGGSGGGSVLATVAVSVGPTGGGRESGSLVDV